MSRWPSLTTAAMTPVWDAVRQRLEQSGVDNRGRVALAALAPEARLALGGLLGRQPSSRLDLAMLERSLRRIGVADTLPEALAVLGHPVSPEPARRRREAARGRDARRAAREAAAAWPEEWAGGWIDAVIRAGVLRGFDAAEAVDLVARVRRVLDAITVGPEGMARVELAATVLGDAHALDTGTRMETAVVRALAARSGGGGDPWEAAGVQHNLTSGPALTWNLPVTAPSGLAALVGAATTAGLPLHLSRFALERFPIEATGEVLVVENPRVVEAAAQARSAKALVSADGAPSIAVQTLIRQLLVSGVRILYHGDFDTAGLVLCARLAAAGVEPWRMTAADYRAALAAADASGVLLPLDDTAPPPTPWDPELADVFAAERRIVHEERLIAELIATPTEARPS